MRRPITRRRFLRSGALATGALALPSILPRFGLGAVEKLNLAGIGAGGKGESDIAHCSGENIVALCDVDLRQARATFDRFPGAARYQDYRRMLEKEGGRIDAVTVSTPDHVHAPAALLCMKLGKHVYCQKPLTHSVAEARVMAQVARKQAVATQMGNQGFAHPETRRLAEIVRAGALGAVRQVHVWTDRPIWPQEIDRPRETPPVPPELDWDLWLGPAPVRPYNPSYVPFKWRGWWDFGTGALGDMGCHNMGLPFLALDLRDPVSVEATSSGANPESAPSWSVIRYRFPARGGRAAVELIWYDGGKKPPAALAGGRELPGNGVIIQGGEDTLYVPSYWGGGEFLSGRKAEDFQEVPQRFGRRPESDGDLDRLHHLEWIEACKGGPPALSNFERAGPMTEAVLLGNVALRAGGKIAWDAEKMTTGGREADACVHCHHRKGWELEA